MTILTLSKKELEKNETKLNKTKKGKALATLISREGYIVTKAHSAVLRS